jgi:hypothetical protein
MEGFSTTTLLFCALFVAFELLEVWWQKAPTLYGMLERIYAQYQKSIFYVFLLHPTLYLSIYLMLLSGYNLYLQIVFGLKLADIALKLLFVKKVFLDKELSDEFTLSLHMKIEPYMLYMGVVLYPVMICLGM